MKLRQIGAGVFGSFMNNVAKKVKRFQVLEPFTRTSGLSWERDVVGAGACEAVYVCSPDALHAIHTKECLQNGKHVLVEKPVYNFQSVREVAERSGKVLMIGFHRRHDEEFRKAKKYVEKEASNTKRILIESYDPVPEDKDLANVVCNSVVHDLDVIHWLFDHDAEIRFDFDRSAGNSHHSALDLRFEIKTKHSENIIDVQILYRKCYPKYVQRLTINDKAFGYVFEADPDTTFPADWSISGPCMANEWEHAYKKQYEECANMIQSNDLKRRTRLLDEYSATFNMMDNVAQHFSS